MISGVLLDLAGVIYEGERALPGALDAVNRLRHRDFPCSNRFGTILILSTARFWSEPF